MSLPQFPPRDELISERRNGTGTKVAEMRLTWFRQRKRPMLVVAYCTDGISVRLDCCLKLEAAASWPTNREAMRGAARMLALTGHCDFLLDRWEAPSDPPHKIKDWKAMVVTIRRDLLKRGLQKKIATEAGVTPAKFNDYLAFRREPKFTTAMKIWEAYTMLCRKMK